MGHEDRRVRQMSDRATTTPPSGAGKTRGSGAPAACGLDKLPWETSVWKNLTLKKKVFFLVNFFYKNGKRVSVEI